MKISHLIALGTIGSSLVGCSALKNMDDMKKTTQAMNQTTGQMASTIQQTQVGIVESNAHQQAVQNDLEFATYASRQGATADLREKIFNDMKNEPTMAGKLKYGSMFNQAFEFQVWTPDMADQSYRETLFLKAAEELTETITSLRKASSSTSATSLNNNMMTLYAIAATLHRINPIQDRYAQDVQAFPEYSMLNAITDGLRHLDDVKNNKINVHSLPLYEQRIQQYSDSFVYLLQVRYNFLAAFSWNHLQAGGPMSTTGELSKLIGNGLLVDLFPIKDTSDKKGLGKFFGNIGNDIAKLAANVSKWEPKWDQLPAAQVDRAGEIMEYCVATRDILAMIGQPITKKTEDSLIKAQFQTLQWNSGAPDAKLLTSDCSNFIARSRFKTAMNRYLDSSLEAPAPSTIKGWSGSTTPEVSINSCTGLAIDSSTTFSSGSDLGVI